MSKTHLQGKLSSSTANCKNYVFNFQRAIDPSKRESMVTDLVHNVVRVSSNLIGDRNHQSWKDLGRDEAAQAATSLMVAVEENAFLLADSVTSEKIIIKPTENIREC